MNLKSMFALEIVFIYLSKSVLDQIDEIFSNIFNFHENIQK